MKKLIPILFCLTVFISPLVGQEKPATTSFGKTSDGKEVELYTLKSDSGLVAKVMTRGATLVELHVPNSNGELADVILGFDDVSGYESEGNQYFGCTTGRVCNRIAKGKFTLEEKEYSLAVNNGPNHLHGGTEKSLDKVIWKANPFANERGQGVRFSYISPDGEEGYPGELSVQVTYFISKSTNKLSINYSAKTDKATPVNLTNHAYFNLSGAGSKTVLNHKLRLNADKYTPTDETLIPTGKIESVSSTDLDFTEITKIGDRIEKFDETAALGYDHNFVLNKPEEGKKLGLAAVLYDPKSKRRMKIHTDQPGIQFYSGNFLEGQKGKEGKEYKHRSACCLETQHYPNSVNQKDFPTTILKPDEEYKSTTTLTFFTK